MFNVWTKHDYLAYEILLIQTLGSFKAGMLENKLALYCKIGKYVSNIWYNFSVNLFLSLSNEHDIVSRSQWKNFNKDSKVFARLCIIQSWIFRSVPTAWNKIRKLVEFLFTVLTFSSSMKRYKFYEITNFRRFSHRKSC